MKANTPWQRSAALVLVLAVGALTVITLHAVASGEREMALSDAAFRRADLQAALVHARRAAVLYAPGAPHTEAAYARLVAIAVGSEATGRPEMAERGWRAVRGAILETQHVWVPRHSLLLRANRRLAVLQTPAGTPDSEPRRAQGSEPVAELSQNPAPRLGWTLILVSGLSLWSAGLAVFATRGIGPDGTVRLRQARWGLLAFAVGVACWTLAVLQA